MTYSQLIMVSSYSFKKNAFFCFSQSTCRILSYLKMSKNCEGIGEERWQYMSTGFLCCSVCWTYNRDITKVLWTSASSFKVTHRRRGGAAWRKRECRLNLRIIWDLFLLNFNLLLISAWNMNRELFCVEVWLFLDVWKSWDTHILQKYYFNTYTRGPTLCILGSYWILSIVMVKALVGGSEGFSGAVGDCTLLWGKFSENMQRCEDKQ